MFPSFDRLLPLVLLTGMIRRHDYHRRPRSRHVVAGHPAAASRPSTPLWRPTSRGGPCRLGGHRLPAAHRHPPAAAAHPPARLRQPGHLLAAAARLVARRRVAAAAPTPCRRSRARAVGLGGPASGPPSCTVTRGTTIRAAGGRCAGGDLPADRPA